MTLAGLGQRWVVGLLALRSIRSQLPRVRGSSLKALNAIFFANPLHLNVKVNPLVLS